MTANGNRVGRTLVIAGLVTLVLWLAAAVAFGVGALLGALLGRAGLIGWQRILAVAAATAVVLPAVVVKLRQRSDA